MFIIYQATRSILNISCLLLLGSTELWMGKSRSDGLEILGDQKVAPVARGFRVQVKIFSKKYQKTTDLLIITQLLSRTLSNRSTTVCTTADNRLVSKLSAARIFLPSDFFVCIYRVKNKVRQDGAVELSRCISSRISRTV